jgi:hypothetical protein
MRKPEFTSAAFVRSHGTDPRGAGRWMFRPSRSRQAFDADLYGDTLEALGTYTQAREAVVHFLRDQDVEFVAVLP